MLKFMPNQQIADNTVIDKIILETQLNVQGDPKITVSQFKGAVVVDPNLGNYVVIDFTVTDTTAINIGRIRLNHGETLVAVSEAKDLSIVKEEGKNLKVRLAAQFDGAEKCKFNTTSVNLPYATPFREGVVRFYNGEEFPKSGIVYSAADVDTKIKQVTDSLGNLNQYAKKAEANEFTAANTFTAGITVNGEIGGNAVTDAGTGGDKHIVNVGYADGKYLSKTEAGNTYLTQENATATYLSKTEASSTYLTQTNADATYLKKTDAETAAGNYAKLNADNNFAANTTNTFNGDVTVKGTFAVGESQEAATFTVTADGIISGNAINNDKVSSAESNKLPTEGAVKSALNDVESALQSKYNKLQSQIDGINAGQNLADIVNNTTELAGYDVSHLKAEGDSLPGEPSTPLTIGDKVQVLGGGDVQSCVYELVKGTKQADADIQSTDNAAYYWRYIGVYGTNAYTKAEVDTELAKKVDKTQIITTIDDGTATATNVTSGSAVKTYVDTVANDLPNKYVTLADVQEITGAKTFANGNITIANPNTEHKAKHYVWVTASGDNTTGDYTSSVDHYDLTHNDAASDRFMRARNSDDVFYTSDLTRFNAENNAQFNTRLSQQIGTHYNYTASEILITTNTSDVPDAQIGTPGNASITDTSLKENYVERIRLRKNTSTVDNIEGGFLSAGTSVTDIDLFADNINNVFSKEVSFRVCTPSDNGMTDKSVLRVYRSGIWYRTPDGNSISTTEYQLRTAGSLDFTTSMSELVRSDSYVPTTKAVADFVDNKITGITGGTAFVKTHAPNTNQTIESAITVTEGITVGSNEKPATLTVSGTITGSGVAAQVINTDIPDQVTTTLAVTNFVNDKLAENRGATSNKEKVGAMGLFLYTGGDFKEMGAEVAGASLQAVGMQLPMDGVVSWSQGAAMEGQWKLLNNTIAGEPCLVLAIRVG